MRRSEDRDLFLDGLQRAMAANGPAEYGYRVRRKAGTYIVVRDEGHVMTDDAGNVVRMLGFVSNVTQRRRLEEERAEEARHRSALVRVGEVLISSLDTPVLLERLCQVATDVLGCDLSVVWFRRPSGQGFEPLAFCGVRPEEWEVLRSINWPPVLLGEQLARVDLVEVSPSQLEYPLFAKVMSTQGIRRAMCLALRRGGSSWACKQPLAEGARHRSHPASSAWPARSPRWLRVGERKRSWSTSSDEPIG